MAGSDSSSSDSDFEVLEVSPEDQALLTKLQAALEANPGAYDSHVQVSAARLPPVAACRQRPMPPLPLLTHAVVFFSPSLPQYIEALRRCRMSQQLREARAAMHAAFPLSESLWFHWLSDEVSEGRGSSTEASCLLLLHRALASQCCLQLCADTRSCIHPCLLRCCSRLHRSTTWGVPRMWREWRASWRPPWATTCPSPSGCSTSSEPAVLPVLCL